MSCFALKNKIVNLRKLIDRWLLSVNFKDLFAQFFDGCVLLDERMIFDELL